MGRTLHALHRRYQVAIRIFELELHDNRLKQPAIRLPGFEPGLRCALPSVCFEHGENSPLSFLCKRRWRNATETGFKP